MRRSRALVVRRLTCLALPHHEVEVADFYKHIAADALSEPRRMKQLLTWCGTRALGDKPAYYSEDGNARLAGEAGGGVEGRCADVSTARVIQEELLRDLSNQGALSDWFSRVSYGRRHARSSRLTTRRRRARLQWS